MNKTLSLKDRKSLLSKYPVSESQLQYEFKRSKKKGVAIKEWLDRKYFPVHPPQILYHFTYSAHLRSILKHGIVFGDAVTSNDHLNGINAPSLTTKSKYHNVTSLDEETLSNHGYIRFTVRLEHDDNKLITAKDFYKKHNVTSGVADKKYNSKTDYGTLTQQHFYLGHIDIGKIIAVHKYDYKKQKWIILEEEQAIKDVIKSEVEKHTHIHHLPRLMGNVYNDTTGMVQKVFNESDKYDTMYPIYKYTDYIVKNSSKQQLKKWKYKVISLATGVIERREGTDMLLKVAIVNHNKLMPLKKRILTVKQKTEALQKFVEETNEINKRKTGTDEILFDLKYPQFENYELNEYETVH